MYWNNNLSGRKQRRLAIMVVVRLSPGQHLETNEEEKTYTDNISAHGARVISRHSWQPAERAQVTAVTEESPMCAEVVYCQKLDSDRFCVGLKFLENSVRWSAFLRYNRITDFVDQTDAQAASTASVYPQTPGKSSGS